MPLTENARVREPLLQKVLAVFFKDESFAHMVDFAEDKISLDFGIDRLITISQENFQKIWNEYAMIFGVS